MQTIVQMVKEALDIRSLRAATTRIPNMIRRGITDAGKVSPRGPMAAISDLSVLRENKEFVKRILAPMSGVSGRIYQPKGGVLALFRRMNVLSKKDIQALSPKSKEMVNRLAILHERFEIRSPRKLNKTLYDNHTGKWGVHNNARVIQNESNAMAALTGPGAGEAKRIWNKVRSYDPLGLGITEKAIAERGFGSTTPGLPARLSTMPDVPAIIDSYGVGKLSRRHRKYLADRYQDTVKQVQDKDSLYDIYNSL